MIGRQQDALDKIQAIEQVDSFDPGIIGGIKMPAYELVLSGIRLLPKLNVAYSCAISRTLFFWLWLKSPVNNLDKPVTDG